MALRVRDLFNLEIMKNFKLIAGQGGLDRPIEATEILDFEFIKGVGMNRDKVFEGRSIALSSLLFAKDNPSLILDAVKRLYELNVSCFAYKTVIIKEIPEEVIEFANENNFPILEFGGDEFFEDVILSVTNEVNRGSDIEDIERNIEKVLARDFTSREVFRLLRSINPNLRKFIKVAFIWDEQNSADEVVALIKKHAESERLRKNTALCKFRSGSVLVFSQDEPDENRFKASLEDVFIQLGVDRRNVNMGVSTIQHIEEGAGRAIREAFWSCVVSQIEETECKQFEEMGVYRFIIPGMRAEHMRIYMNEYLSPILRDEQHELLRTAEAYVLSCGDVVATANRMFCHKNTIRYRVSKLKEILDPKCNDKEFYESLSAAIRIYLLIKYYRLWE